MAGPVYRATLDHEEQSIRVVVQDVEGGLGHLFQPGDGINQRDHVGIGKFVTATPLLEGLVYLRRPDDALGGWAVHQCLELRTRLDERPGIVNAVAVGIASGSPGHQVIPRRLAAHVLEGIGRILRLAICIIPGMPSAHDHVGGAVIDHLLADFCIVVATHVVSHVPGRGGVGPLDAGHHAGGLALLLGQLESVFQGLLVHVDAYGCVVRLDAGR